MILIEPLVLCTQTNDGESIKLYPTSMKEEKVIELINKDIEDGYSLDEISIY